jgi:hypothetical protein
MGLSYIVSENKQKQSLLTGKRRYGVIGRFRTNTQGKAERELEKEGRSVEKREKHRQPEGK